MTTLYDVAKAAGVSTATVSRALHGLESVKPSTRERIEKVIRDLDYVPDGAAQSLSRRQKDVIGLASVERLSPETGMLGSGLLFVEEVLRGVEQTLRGEGWSLLISFLESGERAQERLQALSGKVDGLLLTEGIVPSAVIARLGKRMPIVIIAGSRDEKSVDVVLADGRAGTKALVSHLIEDHGHRRLYGVTGPLEAPDALERRVALELAVAEHHGSQLVGLFEGAFNTDSGQAAARELLSQGVADLPDAVVCGNDQMALGVMRELSESGVRVPEQVAVVGFDDIYPGAMWHPPLTTVRQPSRALGEQASARLLQRIRGQATHPGVEILPTEVIIRSSCGCTDETTRKEPKVSVANDSVAMSRT